MTAVMENKIEFFGNKILEIEVQISEAVQKKEKLTERRKEIALSATSGNLKSERDLARTTQEALNMDAEIDNLNYALNAAHASLGKAKEEADQQEAEERAEKVQELAQRRVKAAQLVDQKFNELQSALSDHKAIASEMGVVYGNACYPLKGAISRAAFHHQLNDYIELFRGPISRAHFVPFETIDTGNMKRRGIQI